MPDREKVIKAIEICIKNGCKDGIPNQLCPYSSEVGCDLNRILADALAMLNEQEEQKQKWLQNIADNQLAFAPSERDNAYCYIKHQGIYDGLQMAYDILTEGR